MPRTPKMNAAQRREAARLLRAGDTLLSIADHFEVSTFTIHGISKSIGLAKKQKRLTAKQKRDILKRAKAGEPYPNIAATHKYSEGFIGGLCRAAGITRAPRQTQWKKEEIVKRLMAGQQTRTIANDLGVNPWVIHRLRKKVGLPPGKRGRPMLRYSDKNAKVVELRCQGMSFRKIGELQGTSRQAAQESYLRGLAWIGLQEVEKRKNRDEFS